MQAEKQRMDVPQEGVSREHINPGLASANVILNPYASEYVPFSHIASSRGSDHAADDHHKKEVCESSTGGPIECAVFRSCDGEWDDGLPDDIFPDLHSALGNGNNGGTPLAGFPVHGHCGNPETSLPRESVRISNDWEELYSDYTDHARWWDEQNIVGCLTHNSQEFPCHAHFTNKKMPHGREAEMDECESAQEYLTSQFPGFSAESVMGVYVSNNCDLQLTIEMLAQLEIQVTVDPYESMRGKTEQMGDLNAMEFPALRVCDGSDTVSVPSGKGDAPFVFGGRRSLDFAAVARRAASIRLDSSACKQNGAADDGASGRAVRDKRNRADCPAPVWLETGEAVANLYGEMREEARDLARLRNAYFEQARQAYLVGNKGLAKELSVKGQMYNARMKAAHEKAREAIFRRRNPPTPSSLPRDSGGAMMIDLHGLHASEAVRVLRHELCSLRAEKRRVVVRVCVGTGHHTKGSKTPSRLPIAVQRYLVEEEALHFTEPQPGLLQLLL